MRNTNLHFVLFLLLFGSFLPGSLGQWTEMKYPASSLPYSYLNGGSVTYSYSSNFQNELYFSPNGLHFNKAKLSGLQSPIPIFSSPFTSAHATGDTLLFIYFKNTQNLDTYYSTDRGDSWNVEKSQTLISQTINHYTFCNANRIFLSQGGGLFFSDNYGLTFTKHSFFTDGHIQLSKTTNNVLIAKENFQSLYSSADNGETWSSINLPSGLTYFRSYLIDNKIYVKNATSGNSPWYRCDVGGSIWETLNQMPPYDAIDFFKADQTYFFSFTESGLVSTYTSQDDCKTWTKTFDLQRINQIHNQVLCNISSGTNSSLVSTTNGLTWRPGWMGLNELAPRATVSTPECLHMGGQNSNIFQYFDEYPTPEWSVQNLGQTKLDYAVTDQNIIAGKNSNGLVLSFDGGRVFVTKQSVQLDLYLIEAFGGVLLFLSNQTGKFYVSSDFGTTIQLYTGIIDGATFITKSNTQLAVFNSNGIFASNRSNPLNFIQLKATPTFVVGIFSAGEYLFYYDQNNKIYRYSDDKWEACQIPTGLTSLNPQGIGNKNELLLYNENWDPNFSLFSSKDEGRTWLNISSEIPDIGRFGRLFMTNKSFYLSFEDNNFNSKEYIYSKPTTNSPLPSATGLVYHDENQNGVREASEPPAASIILKSSKNGYYAVSDTSGSFSIKFADQANDTIRPIPQSKYQFVTTPDAVVDTANNTALIGVATIANQRDLCVLLSNDIVFRPGFETRVYATVTNVGTTTAGGQLSLILPSHLVFVNAIPAQSSQVADTLYFTVPDLQVGQSMQIVLTVKTNVSTTIGTQLSLIAQIAPVTTDADPLNNSFTLRELVLGSYDPNDKAVSPQNLTPAQAADRETLYYTVRFQNTGNYPATYVRILDTLDQRLDVSTIQVLAASHDYTWTLHERNILDVFFKDINLLDSFSNEPASHGFVKFSIKPKAGMQLGESISNTAHIYFDFNPAVVTNTVKSSVTVRTNEPQAEAFGFSIAPNPGVGPYFVRLDEPINEPVQIQIIDASGRVCARYAYERMGTELTLPNFGASAGTYLVQLKTESGVIVSRKLVVQ
jgi:fimbrial isopeptide formation D2 family protein